MTDVQPGTENRTVSRRTMLAGAVVGGAGAAFLGATRSADAKVVRRPRQGTAVRARHHRPARSRLQLGLLQRQGVRRRRAQRRRHGQDRDVDQGDARGARQYAHPRRRRHHPGHPPDLLLRRGRPHHRRGRPHAPDGGGDERGRLRRRLPGQPRVQLRRCRSCASSSRSCTTRCSGRTPWTGTPARPRSPSSSSRRSRSRAGSRRATTRARTATSRSASSGSRLRVARSGTRPTSRARSAWPASSSRPSRSSRG